jgi:hypothetical protein
VGSVSYTVMNHRKNHPRVDALHVKRKDLEVEMLTSCRWSMFWFRLRSNKEINDFMGSLLQPKIVSTIG